MKTLAKFKPVRTIKISRQMYNILLTPTYPDLYIFYRTGDIYITFEKPVFIQDPTSYRVPITDTITLNVQGELAKDMLLSSSMYMLETSEFDYFMTTYSNSTDYVELEVVSE